MSYREATNAYRRALVYRALVENGFSCKLAGRALGMRNIERSIKTLGIDVDQAQLNFQGASLLAEETMNLLTRARLDSVRESVTKKFRVGGVKGYVVVGLYADGRPGELFIKLDKVGSTARGFADAWALQVSLGLQYGLPLEVMISKAEYTRFEPMGATGDPDIPTVTSVLDYVARWLRKRFLKEAK